MAPVGISNNTIDPHINIFGPKFASILAGLRPVDRRRADSRPLQAFCVGISDAPWDAPLYCELLRRSGISPVRGGADCRC